MRLLCASGLVAIASLALGCGGRYSMTVADDGGSSSSGGKTSHAGSTSSGGSGVSIGGGSGTEGGTASGGGCACAEIGCAPPYRSVPDADGCCSHCELDMAACQKQRDDYQQFKAGVVKKYGSQPCMTAEDCRLYFDMNQCGASSCGVVVPSSSAMDLDQVLGSYAEMTCDANCPMQPVPPCDAAPAPECVMNHCQ
jgi:hypothetical protein